MSWRDRVLTISFSLVALCAAVAPGQGSAQGVPVVDASAIAAAQQNLQMLQQQLQQLRSLLNTAQGLAKTVGQIGPLALTLPQALAQSGLDQFSAAASAGIAGINPGSQLQSVLDQIRQQKGLSASGGATPDFSSFASSQEWVTSSFTTAPGASATAVGLGRQARSMAAGEAAADGYALALSARQQVGTIAGRSQSLSNQVAAANTLREDVAANTAVMLAVHDEMAEIQALMASLLAVQSTGQMAASDMAVAPSQGGAGGQ